MMAPWSCMGEGLLDSVGIATSTTDPTPESAAKHLPVASLTCPNSTPSTATVLAVVFPDNTGGLWAVAFVTCLSALVAYCVRAVRTRRRGSSMPTANEAR